MAFAAQHIDARLIQARALLAAAGYGPDNPLRLTYSHSTLGQSKRVAVAVAAMWKRIGVVTALSAMEGKVMFANLRQGNFEVAYAGWAADYNDAASFLYLLRSTSVASNYSRYRNEIYDILLKRAETEADPTMRRELLRQAEALAMDDQPILPLAVGVSKHLVAPYVRGWLDNAVDVHLSRHLFIR